MLPPRIALRLFPLIAEIADAQAVPANIDFRHPDTMGCIPTLPWGAYLSFQEKPRGMS